MQKKEPPYCAERSPFPYRKTDPLETCLFLRSSAKRGRGYGPPASAPIFLIVTVVGRATTFWWLVSSGQATLGGAGTRKRPPRTPQQPICFMGSVPRNKPACFTKWSGLRRRKKRRGETGTLFSGRPQGATIWPTHLAGLGPANWLSMGLGPLFYS